MAGTTKNPAVERLAQMPFDKDRVSPMPQVVRPPASDGFTRSLEESDTRREPMGVARPTRDKAEGDRDKVSPDVERASRVSESSTADAQDLPDVSAPPPGETPRADIHDLPRNEAFRHGATGGIEGSLEEATPVRGPSASASTGRVVTERETVANDEADADATDRNAARQDDPDRV